MKVVFAFVLNTVSNFAIGLLVAKFLGPDQFGRFALTLAVAMALQTGAFDWIRLSAARFYSERSRAQRPETRATLDRAIAAAAALVAIGGVLLLSTPFHFTLSRELIALAIGCSITNGVFDYSTALARARFDDALYGRIVALKTSPFAGRHGRRGLFRALRPRGAGGGLPQHRRRAAACARGHSRPGRQARPCARRARARLRALQRAIVAANVLYILIPLGNRAALARGYGFAETGQYSLAFDMGARIVAAIGTALDVLLFQMAVRADELHGAQEGRRQVADNIGVVFAIIAPACVGLWLVTPSLEALIAPAEYRGPFGAYFDLLLPGFFCSGMINFAINPIFQIAKRRRR